MTGCEAAGVRFELTDPCGSAVFKTAPFDRSGTPPRRSMVRGGAAGSGFARLALVELGLSLLGEPSRPLCVRDHLLPRLEVSLRHLLLRHRRLRAAFRSARATVLCRSH